MSDCLLTTLPVKVPGDLEKMGYFMLKGVTNDTYQRLTIHLKPTYGVPFLTRWNTTTKYSDLTSTSPKQFNGAAQYNTLSWIPINTMEESTVWIEKANIRALECMPYTRIKEESGFDWMINSDEANLEFLYISNHNIIGDKIFKCRGKNLKCLILAAENLQNYQIQEVLDNCPNLIYIYLVADKDNIDDSTTQISYAKRRNLIFPDNLKYIRVAPDKITSLSANCIECLVDENTKGNIEDFVLKAIESGDNRNEGYLSIRRSCSIDELSNDFKYNNAPVKEALTSANPAINSSYFVFSWTIDNELPVITLAGAESLHSYVLTYINYRNDSKLGSEFLPFPNS